MLCEILSNELMVDSVIYDYIYHNQWIKVKSRMLPREEWVRHRTYCFFLMVGISKANNLLLAENK